MGKKSQITYWCHEIIRAQAARGGIYICLLYTSNPGNIGSRDRIQAVVDKAKEYQVPIRVGVNSGSLEKELVEKYGKVTAEGLVESALDKVRLIEEMGYDKLVVSIKSSDVLMCVRAHELIADVLSLIHI